MGLTVCLRGVAHLNSDHKVNHQAMDQKRCGLLDWASPVPTPDFGHRVMETRQRKNSGATHVPTGKRSTGAPASPVEFALASAYCGTLILGE